MNNGGFQDKYALDRANIQALLSNYKLTPATLAQKLSRGTWIAAPHLQYIAARVAAGITRGNARIIISAPPRHGKSELTSVYTPTWVLEKFSGYKIILAGYGADLVTGFSRRVRDMFTSEDNQPLLDTRVRRDAGRVEAFLTDRGGEMYAVGVGGPITGRGAHVLLIDDYIKEIKEALSPTYREYIWNWFSTTAFTRLEPGGSCIIIATRWHSDDLIGRILNEYADQNWEYIELPAIATEGDLIGRAVGEPLFPERYPLPRLQELQTVLGSVYWGALFQQRPVDETQRITDGKWLEIISEVPEADRRGLRLARVWDLAATQDAGDYTVGTLLAYSRTSQNTYILNVQRKQVSPQACETLVKNTAKQDGLDVEIVIEQEPGSSGIHLVDHYRGQVLKGYKVSGVPATKKKLIRAQPFIAACEAGKVKLLAGLWNKAFVKEFDQFPASIHDDQVDTASAGYVRLSGKKIFSAAWGRHTGHSDTDSDQPRDNANSKILRQAMVEARLRTGVVDERTSRLTFGR